MKKIGLRMFRWGMLLIVCVACTPSIVLKPEVYEIEKIAIVSLYSNHGIYNIREGSGLEKSISELGAMSGKDQRKQFAAISDFGGNKLVDYSLSVYERELSKVKGWSLVPFKSLKSKKAFKAFRRGIEKSHRALASISKHSVPLWKTPQGMPAFSIAGNDTNSLPKDEIEYLRQTALSLGLNAVAVIHLDLGYTPYVALEDSNEGAEGTGTARASVASSIKIVTSSGHVAVLTPQLQVGKGVRFSSHAKTVIIGGDIRFNQQVEKMYKEAISKGAVSWRKKISQAL